MIKKSTITLILAGVYMIGQSASEAAARLKDATIASREQVAASAAEQPGLVYIHNDTYLADPNSLLGSILVITKDNIDNSRAQPVFALRGFRNFNRVLANPKY